MPFIPVTGAAQFNVRGTINGIPMENVLHFGKEADVPWTYSELEAALIVLRNAWAAEMLPVLAGGYQALTIYARDLSTEAGAIAEISFSPLSVGTIGGETMPGSVAVCLTHRTNLAGRSFRGRTYIGGISELSVNGNEIVSGYAAVLLPAFQSVMEEMAASNWLFVIVSRYTNNLPRENGIYTVVQSISLRDNTVDSQRRRLR